MNKLTKRILTANDVIMQVRAGKFAPTASVFIAPSTRGRIEAATTRRSELSYFIDETNPAIVQEAVIEQNGAGHCEACANGCLFLAHVARFDSVDWAKFKSVYHDTVQKDTPLAAVFGRPLLNEIEAIFEARIFGWHKNFTATQIAQMQAFRSKVTGVKTKFAKRSDRLRVVARLPYETQSKLLVAIMEKLIANDGKKVLL